MERHYIVWTGTIALLAAIVATITLIKWYINYRQHNIPTNPIKVNLLDCTFNLFWTIIFIVLLMCNTNTGNGHQYLNEIIREGAKMGITVSVIATLISITMLFYRLRTRTLNKI